MFKAVAKAQTLNATRTAWRVFFVYISLGISWIYFSGILISEPQGDAATVVTVELIKGMAYVLVTGLVIFALVYRALKAAESAERVRAAEQKTHRTLLGDLPGMVYRSSATECWLAEYVSAGIFGLTGYTSDEFESQLNKRLDRLVFEEDRAIVEEEVHRARSENRAFECHMRIQRKDGELHWAAICGRTNLNAAGEYEFVEGFIFDTQQTHNLELQIQQSQRMESVGRLAGGIAHDFNNLLSVIQGYGELLQKDLELSTQAGRRLEKILLATERSVALVKQLLLFSRKRPCDQSAVDLNEVIQRLSGLLTRLIGEDIEIVSKLGSDLPPVLADPTHIEQILMNLVVNSRDAMPAGGTLTIRTAAETLDAKALREMLGSAEPGEFVRLSVEDSGVGMDAQTQARIFDPFFTTKTQDKGTGLGLATIYGILNSHRGCIAVHSVPGHGSLFEVYLPQTTSERMGAQDAASQHLPTLRGSETILLVEDEALVRDMLVGSLRESGYTVLSARDTEDALNIANKPGVSVDLLISDVVLPRGSGPELALRLREKMPDLPVLLMTGYAARIEEFREVQGAEVLQKPIVLKRFNQQVRLLLSRAASQS